MSYEYKNTDPSYLYKQFADIAEDMMLEFKRLKRDKATNRTDEGEYLETLLLDFLIAYLPKKVQVGRGYIMNSVGHRSLQQDIVIYDPHNYVLLNDTDGFQIYPVECVHATIEVKSTLTKEVLQQVNRNIKSIKGLSRYAVCIEKSTGKLIASKFYGSRIFSSVFAFQSDSKISTCADNIGEINEAIDCAFILDKGVIFYFSEKIEQDNEKEVIEITTKPNIGTDDIGWINPEKKGVSAYPIYYLLESIIEHIEEYGKEKGEFSIKQYVKLKDSYIVSTKTKKHS